MWQLWYIKNVLNSLCSLLPSRAITLFFLIQIKPFFPISVRQTFYDFLLKILSGAIKKIQKRNVCNGLKKISKINSTLLTMTQKEFITFFSFYRMYGLFISHPLNFIIFLLALVFAKVLTDNLSYMCW